jgi:hypothetical protein
MTTTTKPLTVIEPVDANVNTKAVNLKPAKSAVKLINADNLDELTVYYTTKLKQFNKQSKVKSRESKK